MNQAPQSPILAIAVALICAALAYLCHRLVKAVETNSLLPLSQSLKGDKGRSFPLQGVWPFRDKFQVQFVQRSFLHALLLLCKWGLGLAAAILGVVYPLVYAVRFVGT